jgi:hypothetical protein
MSSLLEDVTPGIIVPTFQRNLLLPTRKVLRTFAGVLVVRLPRVTML